MAYSKKAKDKFLKIIEAGEVLMPREIIMTIQQSMFDEPETGQKYLKMRFELLYPKLKENEEGNPMAKQSFKPFVQRDKEGNVFLYKNPQGKMDCILKGYTESKITTTSDMLTMQMRVQIGKNHRGFRPFDKDVHVTRCEFIFAPIGSLSKDDHEALKTGSWIVFKDTKPDLDNLEKMVWDAMAEAGVFTNDSRISSKNGIFKRYGVVPGVVIELEGRI